MRTVRVAVFMRASTNRQTNAGRMKKLAKAGKQSARPVTADDDLPLQREKITECLNNQPEASKGIKWELTGLEYVEAGVSGFHTHVNKRKALTQAMEDAQAGLFDLLIIYKLDRFGRRSVESLNHAIKFLRYCRIWVVDKNREFTNNGDADEIMNFIEFWSAKKASQDTKTRVTDMMKIIHKEGYWTGGNPPYGYRNHPTTANMLEIIPEEAEVIKEIYKMYTNDGNGMVKIAGILNEKGFQSRTGRNFTKSNITKILRNSIYKGHLSYGKSVMYDGENGSYEKYVKQGEESISDRYWAEYDIVGAEVWEKAQNVKKQRVNDCNDRGFVLPVRRGTSSRSLLVGVLKCACGANMTYSTSNVKKNGKAVPGERYGIYRCVVRQTAGASACCAEKASYKVVDLDKAVIDKVSEYLKGLLEDKVLSDLQRVTMQSTTDIKTKVIVAKREVDKWKQAKDTSNSEILKIMKGEDSCFNREQLTELYTQATSELAKAEKNYHELLSLQNEKSVSEEDLITLQKMIEEWEEIFELADIEVKRQMLHPIVSEVRVDKADVLVGLDFDVAKFVNVMQTAQTKLGLYNGNSSTAQSFNSRKLPDYCILFGHSLNTK